MDWVAKIPWGDLWFWGVITLAVISLLRTTHSLYQRWRLDRIAKAVEAKAKIRLFEDGDLVTLKKENPFNGMLTCGKVYRVKYEHYNYICLDNTDNETKGMFMKKYFEKATYDPHSPGAIEYDEIMEIQEAIERENADI